MIIFIIILNLMCVFDSVVTTPKNRFCKILRVIAEYRYSAAMRRTWSQHRVHGGDLGVKSRSSYLTAFELGNVFLFFSLSGPLDMKSFEPIRTR